MGHFKRKSRSCHSCGARWTAHEEKETDVNIAVALVRLAFRDAFDSALLITRDSDLAPAIRAMLADHPKKTVTVVAPPCRGHSNELIAAATSKAKITVAQLERALLPDVVTDAGGNVVARRPAGYAPRVGA